MPTMQSVSDANEKDQPEHHYAGPRQQPQELAFLFTLGERALLFVRSLDDENLGSAAQTVTLPLQLYLLPGKHVVHAQYVTVTNLATGSSSTRSPLIPLEGDLQANHSYVVMFDASQGNRMKFKLVDLGASFPRGCAVYAIHKGIDSAGLRDCVSKKRPS